MVVGGSKSYAIVVVAGAFGCKREKVFNIEGKDFSPIYHPALSCIIEISRGVLVPRTSTPASKEGKLRSMLGADKNNELNFVPGRQPF